jgi:hypothetical protein
MGDIIDSLTEEDATLTKVFVMGANRERLIASGGMFRCFNNVKIGCYAESKFRNVTVAHVCAMDDSVPIVFTIDYKVVKDEVSDEEF